MHVMETNTVPPGALLGYILSGDELIEAKENLRKTFEDAATLMLEEKTRELEESGISKVSYKIKNGKPSDEIVNESEVGLYDLIVMASS